MNKILKTSLLILAGIIFFGASYVSTPVVYADTTTITSFTVNGKSAARYESAETVDNGASVTFRWATAAPLSPATYCTLTGGNIADPGKTFPGASSSYSQQVTIDNTSTTPQDIEFGLQCFAPRDTTNWVNPSTYLTITVKPVAGDMPVVGITASPQQIAADGTTQQIDISWQASNTKSPNGCVASGPGDWNGPRDSSGTWHIKPPLAGTYKLECASPSGKKGVGEVTVTTAAPPGVGDQGGQAPPNTSTTDLSKLVCMSWGSGVNVGACAALAIYYVIYLPASWILYGAGFIFDTVLVMSVDKKYVIQPFIDKVWTLIRDFSNMIFIFVLLYTGIMTMLGQIDWRKTVIRVIIIALFINFSLFFTKVVIDAGNILAVGVYSSMGKESTRSASKGDLKQRDLSSALVAGFNPQSFIGATAVKEPLDAIVIFLIAAALSVYTAYIFFKASLIFIGRLIAFWYLMIISPFAFVSWAVPKQEKIFNSWVDLLVDQAFLAPVFLFLIYIIMQIIDTGIMRGLLNSDSAGIGGFFFDKLIVPIILGAMILIALDKALGVAKKMGGEFGAAVSNYVGKAVGTVAQVGLAAATGGAALAAGKLGATALASGALQKGAASTSVLTRGLSKGLLLGADKLQNATFDPRNIGGGIGTAIGAGMGSIGMDKKGSKMTYTTQTEAWRKPQEERQKKLATLMERPETSIQQEKDEAAKANRELSDLDRLVKIAEDTARNTQSGKALLDAEQKEKNRGKEAAAALKKQSDAYDALKKLLADPTIGTDPATGKKAGEDAAASAFAAAKAEAEAAGSAHADAKQVLADTRSTYDATPEAIELAATRERQSAQQKIKDQKDKDYAQAKADLAKENVAIRERYAQEIERSAFTSAGVRRAQERADKIRKDPEAKKAKKESDKLLASIAEAMKKGTFSVETPPTGDKPKDDAK